MSTSWRRDRNALVLFSSKDGTKIRLALGKYEKASRPELCDVKITDYCPVGCAFCYQDSTLQGRHASWDSLTLLVERLASARVFEVALGGGEALLHPNFVALMHLLRENNIVPNFTTKLPGRVRALWPEISAVTGAFAYSAESAQQVSSAARVFKNFIPDGQISLHYVMGLGNRQHFENYLREAHRVNYRVTLLGYKTSGRGNAVMPQDYRWWIESVSALIRENVCPSLSIDTPLAHEYDGLMPVPRELYSVREGAYSLYIDAVAMKMGASSYENADGLEPFDGRWLQRYAHL